MNKEASLQLTLLFTDIEGSTHLWESNPERMEKTLARHFELLGEAVAEHGGTVEVETGDGILASFPTARQGALAAVDGQRKLREAGWELDDIRVRMGLHTAEVGRDELGLHGTEVHRAARLMDTAHGGQVVVSEATYALVRDDPPPRVAFRDLGTHRLKDLTRPEHIHQILHSDLRADFPPLRSLEGFANNLPAQLSSFVGRQDALEAVHDVLEVSRLVTLTGAGGSGKTRLALQAAANRIEQYQDGVWLVELGGLADPELLDQTVVSTLGIPERPGQAVLDVLTDYLRPRELLVLIDNCEHLIESVAGLVEALLRACPRICVLATSREPLNVPGEVIWLVPSMDLGVAHDTTSTDHPPEAIALFVERAKSADPSFVLSEENVAAIATICRRLDGLPLAIELAAARVRALSVEDIANRLEDRFELLAAGSRTALPRQRTLEAAVAWSHELLEPDERELFAHLGVFQGSFDLYSAEMVGAVGDFESFGAVDLLTALVDKSLVTTMRDNGQVRYRMLETIRQYARTRLADSPHENTVRQAHTRWALDFAREAKAHIAGPEMKSWMAKIRSSFDDLRVVLERSVDNEDPETGLQILVDLEIFLVQAAPSEGTAWVDRLLMAGEITEETRAQALCLRGLLLLLQGDPSSAASDLEESLGLLEGLDDPGLLARCQLFLAVSRWGSSEETRELFGSALETFIMHQIPGPYLQMNLFAVSVWEFQFGERTQAVEFASQLQALGEETDLPFDRAHAAELFALDGHFTNEPERAREKFAEAIGYYRRAGFRLLCFAHCLDHVALWSLGQGHPEDAATLLGAVEALRQDHTGSSPPPFEQIWHNQTLESTREQLDAADFDEHFKLGRTADPSKAAELAGQILKGAADTATAPTA